MDCRIFNSYKGTGIAVLTCTFRIFITNSIDDVRLKRLAEVPGMSSQLMGHIPIGSIWFAKHLYSKTALSTSK